jgi:hypothetical protein
LPVRGAPVEPVDFLDVDERVAPVASAAPFEKVGTRKPDVDVDAHSDVA